MEYARPAYSFANLLRVAVFLRSPNVVSAIFVVWLAKIEHEALYNLPQSKPEPASLACWPRPPQINRVCLPGNIYA
ncbi:hypothetical protein [Undibacterium sp. Ren11W]|uniref:hypothetical protein n=1 Tax=Undibacterium sp. Ren11W TaxID=3413045 RepID=UPI003BF275CE